MPPPVAPSFSEYRLPRGRHGIPPERVRENQRWRMLGACAELIAESGYGALTVRRVTEVAAVSKATFYGQFESLGECVLATYEMATASALAVTVEACRSSPDPAAALAVAVASVLELLAQEPALAHVLTDGALDDVEGLYPVRSAFAERCAAMLASTARETGDPSRRGRLSLHRVRATKGWISNLLGAGTAAALPKRAPELTELLSS